MRSHCLFMCVVLFGALTAPAHVLAQPEMEKRRPPLVHRFRPDGRGFSRHVGGLSSDDSWVSAQRERVSLPRCWSIGSMSPAKLSLSMVASPQSPLLFHLAKSL
jgi:hypothetical protein